MIRFCACIALLLFATPAFAQNRIEGRVIDANGKPVPSLAVVLHSVRGTGGNEVARDTTDGKGEFAIDASTVADSAVYFIAVVWEGQLYVGDMLRPPFPHGQEYVVQVGVNPVTLDGGASPPTGGNAPVAAPDNRTAGTVVIIATMVILIAVIAFARRRRPPQRRRWLVELARLEDELEERPDNAVLLKRRAALRERLKAPAGD